MNIEELKNNICELHGLHATKRISDTQFSDALRTLLTTYTCEVAKIDYGMFYDIYMNMKINGVSEHAIEYNRLISEKYQAQPETPEPELQVGATANDIILSTGRPVQKQPSPDWWENLKEGDLVMSKVGDLLTVVNWYQENLGKRQVWIQTKELTLTPEHLMEYNPTPEKAIKDLQNGIMTVKQFKKVYKG